MLQIRVVDALGLHLRDLARARLDSRKDEKVPIMAPQIDPMGLKACEKLSLRTELSGSPSCAMSGLAPVSRKPRPLAMTKERHQEREDSSAQIAAG